MAQTTLFGDVPKTGKSEGIMPLAGRMRPRDLDEFVGQGHLLGEGRILRNMIEQDKVPSMIFWGPPGVGKTTLAGIIANRTKAEFVSFSAVTGGTKEVKEIMSSAEKRRQSGRRTVLFVDEIHRFNKAQQDAFLPYVEKGSITLIGATTENPSFEVNSALLSRCKVFVLQPLSSEDIFGLLRRAAEKGFPDLEVSADDDILRIISEYANGDARTALNTLEAAVADSPSADGHVTVTKDAVADCISRKSLLYDKSGEEHYNIISALHKSMRNSDPDAAVYYLARMLYAGEDIKFIARRIMICASEDVGNADPMALTVAVSAAQAVERIGMPEAQIILSQAVLYVATAPKSNAAYNAVSAAMDNVKRVKTTVPPHLQDAHYKGSQNLGHGVGYRYAHDYPKHYVEQQYLPDEIKGEVFYEPGDNGYEAKIKEHMRWLHEQ